MAPIQAAITVMYAPAEIGRRGFLWVSSWPRVTLDVLGLPLSCAGVCAMLRTVDIGPVCGIRVRVTYTLVPVPQHGALVAYMAIPPRLKPAIGVVGPSEVIGPQSWKVNRHCVHPHAARSDPGGQGPRL
jgi:hypothetical protein